MFDLRPLGYVIGLMVGVLGLAMLAPALLDAADGDGNWRAFLLSACLTALAGAVVAIGCRENRRRGLSIQQAFLLTVLSWLALPVFGALPFVLGAPGVDATDAFFESMSGLTTTGATVFEGLEDMPRGVLFWRGLLQWFGGVGIVVVAMAFLPMLKVGGMQIFRSESFDTMGKILPRAAEIAASISWIYLGLTLACAVAYAATGMDLFDAVVHAMTTIATGGFANADTSFSDLGAGAEYVGVLFMLLAALPFVRYVQLASGAAGPLWRDAQVRAFLTLVVALLLTLSLWRALTAPGAFEETFRKALFNIVSILTGTGYASADYNAWGAFAIALFFLMGLIGGCAGSTSCSVKIFRFQIVFAALSQSLRRIHSPHGVFAPRYQGRRVEEEVIASVMAFLFMFVVSLGVVAVALSMMGLDTLTAVSGAASALANIGPGLGDRIGPADNYAGLPDAAKWLLAFTMLVGRLELMSVYVLFTLTFWRR